MILVSHNFSFTHIFAIASAIGYALQIGIEMIYFTDCLSKTFQIDQNVAGNTKTPKLRELLHVRFFL